MTELVFLRHGAAESPDAASRAGRDEVQRELTAEGRAALRDISAGLARVTDSFDLLLASPLRRAVQTAELLGEAFDGPPLRTEPALSPGADIDKLAAALATVMATASSGPERILLVGHEPDFSGIIGAALGMDPARVKVRKASAFALEIGAGLQAGAAQLSWALGPGQLQDLGR